MAEAPPAAPMADRRSGHALRRAAAGDRLFLIRRFRLEHGSAGRQRSGREHQCRSDGSAQSAATRSFPADHPRGSAGGECQAGILRQARHAAAAFKLKADAVSRDRALECLTQAVYYEAASEGADGGRAVAQVVLNRMRHPAYPSTVCGVVYQGSERPIGCQFTFTCDGSLARMPVQSLWKQSQKIAEQALAGKVFAPVGHATHYHADYVLPYWADSLDKSIQIGRHIFYRLKSGLGASSAFRQRYGGVEPLASAADCCRSRAGGSAEFGTSSAARSNPLQVSAGELIASSRAESRNWLPILSREPCLRTGTRRRSPLRRPNPRRLRTARQPERTGFAPHPRSTRGFSPDRAPADRITASRKHG